MPLGGSLLSMHARLRALTGISNMSLIHHASDFWWYWIMDRWQAVRDGWWVVNGGYMHGCLTQTRFEINSTKENRVFQY
jgi:hypothetical protein